MRRCTRPSNVMRPTCYKHSFGAKLARRRPLVPLACWALALTAVTSLGAFADDAPLTASARAESKSTQQAIDFNRDIRPLLSDRCFACHGFDAASRQADLRLDTQAGATADLGGYAAIIPGNVEQSELFKRVSSRDADLVMPPQDSHKEPLDAAEVNLLRRWIDEGAHWNEHWAFVLPVKGQVPPDEHAIDHFVEQRLGRSPLSPAPPASPHTLVRRLSFDITGLPPTVEQVERYVNSPTEATWELLVNELLASQHYGERMAMWWLDGARYSDTDGFQQDGTRTNWPWRDWVVGAFNQNQPFDQFTVEQFAGDLLENATAEQKLATCFHRNHMNNGEGGRDKEESRIDYVRDRVNTFSTLWLGLTLECAQCHDHKFDPVSQSDYYSLSAFFNSIDETGAAGGGAGPYLKYRSPYAQRVVEANQALVKEADELLKEVTEAAQDAFENWLRAAIAKSQSFEAWHVVQPAHLETTEGYQLKSEANGVITSSSSPLPQDDFIVSVPTTRLPRITGVRLEVFPHPSHTDGKYSFSPSGEFILTNVKLIVRRRDSRQLREIELSSAVADVQGVGVDTSYKSVRDTLDDDPRKGWTTRTKPSDVPHVAVFALQNPLILQEDERLEIRLMQRSLAPRELMGRFRLSLTDQRGAAVRSVDSMPMEQLKALLAKDSPINESKIDAKLRKRLFDQFLEDRADWQAAKTRIDQLQNQLNTSKKAAGDINVMVLKERKEPRTTHVLVRGVWDKKGQEVAARVLPTINPQLEATDLSRLQLAQWLVSPENPLTARVIVNQIWQLLFGAGLVRTPNDFGFQGEPPTHPELLDWLAVDFVESGWNVKQLVRTIVTSRTYRQDSKVQDNHMTHDPENRLLARGSRYRLPSWMIRDSLLQTSGLLNPELGGPPVFPYQPEGVWKDQFMGRFVYRTTLGPEQYRRALYAFWRRTSAPTFLFDAAMRRTCEVVPRRTNTPLHALILLNDRTSLEAARALAQQCLDVKKTPGLESMFYRVLSRKPTEQESTILTEQYKTALDFYVEQPEQAESLVEGLQSTASEPALLAELAATMLVANMLLNLDEALTHE